MSHIFNLGGDLTILIISHRLSILKDCNKIVNQRSDIFKVIDERTFGLDNDILSE